MLRKWGALLLTLILAVVLAVFASTPPQPEGLDHPADQFSSARAMKDVRIIAAKPHPTGSEENTKVRAYLQSRLTDLGLYVSVSESLLGERALARLNRWSDENKTEQAIYNVIGVLPGKNRSKPALLLMAHHDTVWGSPGAADDTAGIAAILEIIRAVKETGGPERDIIALFTDGEEVGLSGAVNFFKNNPLKDKTGAIINFEARGGAGVASLFQTSANNGEAAKLFARAVENPSTSSLSVFVYNVLPNDTDLTPALEHDYTAYNIANIGGAEYYHSPKITADALDEGTLQHMGSQGLDLTRALLAVDEFPAKKPDVTFFDVFGFTTLIYPSALGWGFLILSVIFYLVSIDRSAPRKPIIAGAAKMLTYLVLGGGLLYGMNILSGHTASADYYDRLAAIPKLEWLALLTCAAMFFAVFGREPLSVNGRLGASIPIFALGVMGQALAPTAAYFLILPLLLCGFVSLVISRWPHANVATGLAVLIMVPVAGYMLTLGHLLMLGIGPDLLAIAILPAAIAGLAVLPFYQGVTKRTARITALTGFVLAAGLALWVRFDPVASTVPLY